MTKKILENIWYYYKIHIIIGIILIIVIYNACGSFFNKKEPILQIAPINLTINSSKQNIFSEDFKKSLKITSSKKEVFIYDSINLSSHSGKKLIMNSNEQLRLTSYSQANSLDIVIMDDDALKYLCNNGFLCDLEKLTKTKNKTLYNNVKNNLVSTKDVTNDNGKYSKYKCALPINNANYFKGNNKTLYVGIITDSEKKDLDLKYIDYINNL